MNLKLSSVILLFSILYVMFAQAMQNGLSLEKHQFPAITAFLIEKFQTSFEKTSIPDQYLYKFHGKKIPIHRFSFESSTNSTEPTAYILRNAKPAIWYGLSYNENAPATDLICLDSRNSNYRAQIKQRKNNFEIRASCMVSDTGVLAILWRDTASAKSYLTMRSIGLMQKACDIFDLDEDRVVILQL